jgi:hypothetical protein
MPPAAIPGPGESDGDFPPDPDGLTLLDEAESFFIVHIRQRLRILLFIFWKFLM